MPHRWGSAWFLLVAGVALTLPAGGQSVISTHSGVVHFFEGAVYVGDQPLESHLGKFPTVPQGAELRTAEGRAEVLLTPGVFLRIGAQSAIRLVANDLENTQVEFEKGSAMLDSGEPSPGTSVTLIYQAWKVRFPERGIYRIDSDPPRLWVLQGQAEVFGGTAEQPVAVEHGMNLPLAAVLVPEASDHPPTDALSDWDKGRSESIIADNAITAQIGDDPAAALTPGLDAFTYFPLLGAPPIGLPPLGLTSPNPYGSVYGTWQPGFNSIYLPGYTYRPLWLGPGLGPRQGYRGYAPGRIGISPGMGGLAPTYRPPISRPAPIHSSPHFGLHGGHR